MLRAGETNSKVAQFKCNLSQQTSCRATEKGKNKDVPLVKKGGSSDGEFSSGGENRPRANHLLFEYFKSDFEMRKFNIV